MNNIDSIAIITCWYGDYPWYFSYFIKSCAFNPSIDFIIITDNEDEIYNKPENVHIRFKTINNIKVLSSEKLGFEVNIDYPYKLCDFKPAYGFIFSDLLKKYDFWGHGDLDIVYGNIRNFMTKEILDNYDIISSRHDYLTGSFSLFKNNNKVNTLFMESKDYKMVFSSPKHYCFDECNFLFAELQNGASIFDFPENIQSMTYLVKKAELDEKLKAYFDFLIVEGTPGKIKWNKGELFYKDLYEVMFYHLIKFKNECKSPKVLSPIPDKYYFSKNRIKGY